MIPPGASDPGSRPDKAKIIWIAIGALFVVGLLALLGMKLFSSDARALSVGKRPEDFRLQTFSGDTIDTVSLRGKIVLVNFWSSWCATCDEEAVLLEEAWSVYQAEGDVVFLGVAYMDTEPDSQDFLAAYGVTFPNGPDLGGDISHLYRVSSVPETYVLDAQGVLRVIRFGPFASTAEIFQAIESASLAGDDDG